MKEIKQNIKFLYPNHEEVVFSEINKMITRYQRVITGGVFELKEDDIVLITYADSFKDDNETGLQTLNKVCATYLKGSINSIHILPFYSFTSDDGFSVVDYKEINTDFGDWEDVKELAKSFHLMFDAVINHISKSSDWFQGFLEEDPKFENFFIEEDLNHPDLHKVVRPRTWPLLHKYKKNGKKTFVWTTFSEDQVDLNYKNPKVFLRVLDVLLFYISQGAHIIRLDAVAFMWKTLGTKCIHLEETHLIIQTFRRIIDLIAPQTVIVSETNVPHKENISYFGDGFNEAHMVYNFCLPPLLAYSLYHENINVLTNWAKSLQLPSEKTCFLNFTASHDGIGVRPLQGIIEEDEMNDLAKKVEEHGGFVSYKSNSDGSKSPYELNCNYMDFLTNPKESDELRMRRFMLTQSVMICMPGVPAVYYHSIFGSENDVDGVLESGINRRINRQKLNYSDVKEKLSNSESLSAKIFNCYTRILAVRSKEKAFNPMGKAKFLKVEGVFIIERIMDNDTIYCLHNFSHQEKNIKNFADGRIDVITGSVGDDILKPYEFRWLK